MNKISDNGLKVMLIDKIGRVIIPRAFRSKMGLMYQSKWDKCKWVEISLEHGEICVRAFDNTTPIEERPFVGIVRPLDHLGRVIVPMEYRQLLGIYGRKTRWEMYEGKGVIHFQKIEEDKKGEDN